MKETNSPNSESVPTGVSLRPASSEQWGSPGSGTRPPDQDSYRGRWWWLAPLLVLIVVAAVVVPVVLLGGKEGSLSGSPFAGSTTSLPTSRPSSSSLPSMPVLPDGSGFSSAPLDQPYPVPDFFWPGLRDVCEWITPEMARQAGGTGEVRPQEAGCNVVRGGNELVQVSSVGPYDWVMDPARFMRPVTIAGLQAREYAFIGQGQGECSLLVNTRAPVAIQFAAWNPTDRDGGSFEERCRVVRRVAEVLVRRYVPAAGGTPWHRTPQRPAADVGVDMVACELVDQSAAVEGSTDPRRAATGTDPLGTTCTYEGNDTKLVGLVTDGPDTGLSDVEPRLPDATVTERRLGELPARMEEAGTDCAISVEFAQRRIFTITYHVEGVLGLACPTAEVVAANVLTKLIDMSTG